MPASVPDGWGWGVLALSERWDREREERRRDREERDEEDRRAEQDEERVEELREGWRRHHPRRRTKPESE